MAGYSGDAGDAMASAAHPNFYANGRMFSTSDSDNDVYAGGSCAVDWGGGWWFGLCSRSYVNKDADALWRTGYTRVFDVEASRMLVKLN